MQRYPVTVKKQYHRRRHRQIEDWVSLVPPAPHPRQAQVSSRIPSSAWSLSCCAFVFQ